MNRRLVVSLLALVVVVAGCGGEESEPASQASNAKALLRETHANLGEMRSARLDLKLQAGAAGAVRLQGPFTSDGKGRLPKFALSATLESGASTIATSATWTGETAYVAVQGTWYEVSPLLMGQFAAAYEQALKNGRGAGGLPLGGIDLTKWLRDPRNEGLARVGETETVKISGRADAARVMADLDTLVARAGALSLPGVGGTMPRVDRKAAADAVKTMQITVFTGASDRILRRLVVSGEVENRPALLDVTFTDVGREQEIAAPADAKPFSELLKLFDAAGFGGLGEAPQKQPGKNVEPNKVDEYSACIRDADGDRAKARKCASLLSG